MIRWQPTSTLFPYTTLFRSDMGDLAMTSPHLSSSGLPALGVGRGQASRSEEHTSELQSHSDLVCRLLLEKKKQKKYRASTSMHYERNYDCQNLDRRTRSRLQ